MSSLCLHSPRLIGAIIFLVAFPSLANSSWAQQTEKPVIRSAANIEGLPKRIAFGSCGHQAKPQPILDTIVAAKPDLFVYLGDNIYGDTKDMKVLQQKYDLLGAKKEFQRLRAAVPVLSVWDDHDYGWNDAGKEYEFKEESKQIFMDFWNVSQESPRRQHPGIYGSHRFESGGKTLQIILLDTRTFRDALSTNDTALPKDSPFKNAYKPDESESKTLLGDQQWQWLREQFTQPADVRIVCSSIQFGHEYNGWESWTNLPREQQRMVDLIKETSANGVLFISGDVHWGEISKRNFPGLYPLYDVTASGLTEEWHNVEPNQFRVGEAMRDNHFGVIEIDWEAEKPKATLQVRKKNGEVFNEHLVPLSELQNQ